MRKQNNSRLPYFFIKGIVILASLLVISKCIYVNSLLIIILLFNILVLLYIAGLERIFLLFIVFVFIPFEFSFGGVQGWEAKDFVTPVLFLWFLGICAAKNEPLNRVPHFSIPLLLFLLICFAHILTLEELPKIMKSVLSLRIPAGHLRIYYDLFICGIMYFITPFLLKEEAHIRLVVKLLTVLFFIVITLSFMRIYLGIDTLFSDEAYRTRIHYVPAGEELVPRVGVMGVAGYLLFTVALIFVRDRSKVLFFVLISICIGAVVQSGSRTLFLGLIFAISFYLYLKGRKFTAFVIPFGVLVFLLLIGLKPKIATNFPPVFHRHLTIFSSENPSLTRGADTRFEMWTISKEIIAAHPFWGSRSVNQKGEYHQEAIANVIRGGAHNAYLSTAASLGLPALMIWLTAAFLYLHRIVNLYKYTHSYPFLNKFCLWLSILFGVSFLNFFFSGKVGGGIVFFLYMGMIDSAWNIYNQYHKKTTNSIHAGDYE